MARLNCRVLVNTIVSIGSDFRVSENYHHSPIANGSLLFNDDILRIWHRLPIELPVNRLRLERANAISSFTGYHTVFYILNARTFVIVRVPFSLRMQLNKSGDGDR